MQPKRRGFGNTTQRESVERAKRRRSYRKRAEDHSELSDADREYWSSMMDTEMTSVLQFLCGLQIKTEAGKYVDFFPRPKQLQILRLREAAWKRGEKFNAICAKTRRYGVTTFRIMLAVERVLRCPGWVGTLIAKDDADARKFMKVVRETIHQVPEEFWPTIVSFTTSEIILRHGDFEESAFYLVTANKGGLGRGDTNNMLHPTEPPHYKAKAQEEYYGIQPSCGDFEGNEEFWESSCKGYDAMFHPQWEKAHWPGEEPGESSFVRIFIAAYEHPNFYTQFKNVKQMLAFERKVGTDPKYGGARELEYWEILERYHREGELPRDAKTSTDTDSIAEIAVKTRCLEQLFHARRIQEDKCKGDFALRCQEYPMTEREMFQATGMSFFDVKLIDQWLPIARRDREQDKVGVFVERQGEVVFQEQVGGLWVLRADKVMGYSYAFGADTASGRKTRSDGRMTADYPFGYFGEVLTEFCVAYLRWHLKPREFAYELAKASYYFGKAPGLIERSRTGDVGTTISRLEQTEVCGWNASEALLYAPAAIWTDKGRVTEDRVGFDSSHKNKRFMYDTFRDSFVDHMEEDPDGQQRPNIPWVVLDEMQRLQEDEEGKLGPTSGKDDGIDAAGLFTLACQFIRLDPTLMTSVVEEQADPELEAWLRIWSYQDRQSGEGTEVPGMPGY